MKSYLALTFLNEFGNSPILKEWKIREGNSLTVGQSLFLFGEGSQQKVFKSQASGTFKAYLWREGEALGHGEMVAVLEVDEAEAERCQRAGFGLTLSPEEAKGGMSYAEAASIRLPPKK